MFKLDLLFCKSFSTLELTKISLVPIISPHEACLSRLDMGHRFFCGGQNSFVAGAEWRSLPTSASYPRSVAPEHVPPFVLPLTLIKEPPIAPTLGLLEPHVTNCEAPPEEAPAMEPLDVGHLLG
jgi:hypothetical protein